MQKSKAIAFPYIIERKLWFDLLGPLFFFGAAMMFWRGFFENPHEKVIYLAQVMTGLGIVFSIALYVNRSLGCHQFIIDDSGMSMRSLYSRKQIQWNDLISVECRGHFLLKFLVVKYMDSQGGVRLLDTSILGNGLDASDVEKIIMEGKTAFADSNIIFPEEKFIISQRLAGGIAGLLIAAILMALKWIRN